VYICRCFDRSLLITLSLTYLTGCELSAYRQAKCLGLTDGQVMQCLGQLMPNGVLEMDEAQGLSSEMPVSEETSDQVLESPVSADETEGQSNDEPSSAKTDKDSLGFQKRLKRLERNHQRDLRMLQEENAQLRRIAEMQSAQGSQQGSGLAPNGQLPPPQTEEERIARAVSLVLQKQEEQKQLLQQQQNQQYLQSKYQDLNRRFDMGSDKYDDFDDVVRSPTNTKFTASMRDIALGLPNPEEVLYHIGKNPDVLDKISNLRPLDQMKEMISLSHSLISGGNKSQPKAADTIGDIRATPRTSSAGITESTPISDIKARIRNQGFKWK